jgi:cyclohexyl-isocyanide hydratase
MVRDGNVFTGASVTAGIEFALCTAAKVAGSEAAQQLSLEYDPAPPRTAGNPRLAMRERMNERFGARLRTFRGELQQAIAQQAA